MDIEDLNQEFGIEGEIGFFEEEGLGFVSVINKHADATISLYGAHIISYNPARNAEILWMSSQSYFEKGKAIRGGIPVCFPWFGPHAEDDTLPQHGFARIMDWEMSEVETLGNGSTRLVFRLKSSNETKKYWSADFYAEMIFTIGAKLGVSLKVRNTSNRKIAYTGALHTYFSTSGVENIAIEGLKNTPYQNQLEEYKEYVQEEELLMIAEPVTRHYYNTGETCKIIDPLFNRAITIEKEGSKNTTVWNPGAETCAQMKDMPDNAYESFICLETVNNIYDIIRLDPGESHETKAMIGVG